ncbi:MAG: DJ-1/PfpI family protein [Merismopedia sp. SIO2A8]|nr:DJ-1/PfpI family protein [Merismopedia sp. SIO2A8]
MTHQKRNVGILIFPMVEVLDFAGPFEVFSRTRLEPGIDARRDETSAPFNVFTVAKELGTITATGGLQVIPQYIFTNAPNIDLLVVPGGFGTRPLLEDPDTLTWIHSTHQQASLTTSVCTGALLLAKVGLLAGKQATTHWGAYDLLASLDPSITVKRDQRVVVDGIFTSAGVSAGMDMAFAVVESLHGKAVADATAHYIEFKRL